MHSRLNYMAVLHVHQKKVDDLDTNAIKHESVAYENDGVLHVAKLGDQYRLLLK